MHYAALVGEVGGDNAITVSSSTDSGSSWNLPVEVARERAPNFTDKPALTADRRDDSRHRGNVYVAWDVNVLAPAGDAFSRQDIYFARSTGGGFSFEKAKRGRTGLIGGGAVPGVGPGGVVHLVWTGEGTISRYAIYVSRSTNGGKRWSRPRRVEDLIGEGIDGVRDGFSLVSFEVDPETGELFVVWQDGRFGTDQILMMRSTDRGRSWTEPVVIADVDPGVATFTPGVAVNGRGDVAVGYYVLGPGLTADYHVRVSKDAGESFGTTFRMTRKSFCIAAAADSTRGRFLGDYVGLSGAGKRFVAPWIGTQRSVAQLGGAQADAWSARTR